MSFYPDLMQGTRPRRYKGKDELRYPCLTITFDGAITVVYVDGVVWKVYSTAQKKHRKFQNEETNGLITSVTTECNYSPRLLTESPKQIPVDKKLELIEAANCGQKDAISNFVKRRRLWCANETKDMCRDLLHIAAQNNHVEVMKVFLNKGDVDVNAADVNGATALHLAAYYGQVTSVEYLLSRQASISAKTHHGWQPLHHAVWNEQITACRTLLEKGADSSTSAAEGWTPLHIAALRGNTAICNLLLHYSVDFEATTDEGWTPLHMACKCGLLEVSERLVGLGADIQQRNVQGKTALDVAALNDASECCMFLLEETDSFDTSPVQALHCAVESGSIKTVERLIEAGASVNAKGLEGDRAIHKTARFERNVPVIIALHEKDCNITAVNEKGKTAKEIALELRNVIVYQFLLSLEQQLEITYPLQRTGCGEVLIMNNQDYMDAKYPARVGSDKDVTSLRTTFASLGYNIDVQMNLTFTDMASCVWNFVTQPKMKEASLVVIVILAHGSGNILGVDGKRSLSAYDVAELVCKQQYLVGKPKIIITQACRGTQENDGMEPFNVTEHSDTRDAQSTRDQNPRIRPPGNGCLDYRLPVLRDVVMRKAPQTELLSRVSFLRPACGDFIIAESTIPRCQSYRDGSGKGSIFIQALCRVMQEQAHRLCFQDMLTKVNQLVVERFEVPNGTKMQPMFSSALNGKLFLNPRGRKDYYYGIHVPHF